MKRRGEKRGKISDDKKAEKKNGQERRETKAKNIQYKKYQVYWYWAVRNEPFQTICILNMKHTDSAIILFQKCIHMAC